MLSLKSVLGFCHGIAKGGDCKVEFNQPSCWLYSVPNLLVFLQLVTLYLGGNHVKVVCERVLRIAQMCAKKLGLAGSSQLQAAKLMYTCQACQKLKRRASCSLQDKRSRLAKSFAHGLNSRLKPVARSNCQNTLFGKIWLFTFLLTLLYIYSYTHDSKRTSIENFERETLEKTRLTHPQSLPKRLFKFLYSLPLRYQILERLITKTFSHHIHFYEKVVWCFGKQLGRNQFHIGWCYSQVVESGKLEKK